MDRKDFLHSLAFISLGTMSMDLQDLKKITDTLDNTDKMPLYFIGHGNPMHALYDNPFTQSLQKLAASLPTKPQAILVVSAHWLTRGTRVLVSEKPKTIHDFGGFPDELFALQYPAPGAPQLAKEVQEMIHSVSVTADNQWGLDHGAWTVLKHIFPKADIPVFELSIDYYQAPSFHYRLAKELQALRHKGVLIIGSGNIVHNLSLVDFDERAKPFDWAIEFDELVKKNLNDRNFENLIAYDKLGTAARYSIPTNDHYLPMLYILGLADKQEELRYTYEEIQNASISMRCFRIG